MHVVRLAGRGTQVATWAPSRGEESGPRPRTPVFSIHLLMSRSVSTKGARLLQVKRTANRIPGNEYEPAAKS